MRPKILFVTSATISGFTDQSPNMAAKVNLPPKLWGEKKTGPRFSTLRHPPKFTHLTLTLTWWRLWWWSPWDTGWLRPKQWWRGRERKLRQLFAWKSGKPILPGNYHHCYDDIGRTKEGDITIIPKTSWKDICSTIACKTIHSPLNKSM